MKICTRCKEEKTNFPKKSRAKDGLASWCTDCYSEHARQKYKNSATERQRKKANRNRVEQKSKDFIYLYLLEHPCIVCGEDDPVVLEFDHREPSDKSGNVSEMVTYSLRLIKEEIAKCDVLCANCHRRKTAKQFGTWKTAV